MTPTSALPSPDMTADSAVATVMRATAQAADSFTRLARNDETLRQIAAAGLTLAGRLQAGGQVLTCGNGGSMADAIHLAEELSGRFRIDRRPLAGLALSDPGYLTCVANDMGFDSVFSRAVEAFGGPDDVLVIFSTSGSSPNVVRAAEQALLQGMTSIAIVGRHDSELERTSTMSIVTPGGRWSDRAQEMHTLVLHSLVEVVEEALGLAAPGSP